MSNFSRLHSISIFHIEIAESVATKGFLINEMCSLKSEVLSSCKQQVSKMMTNLENTNLLTRLKVKTSLLEQENLYLRNQLFDKHTEATNQ